VNDEWKLFRVISYDHQQPKRYPAMFKDGYPFPLFSQDQQIDQLIKKLNIASVTVASINDGKLQQVRAFGEQTPGVPATVDTIYKVASLTKRITAMVALKLVNAGEWNLDEPVATYYVDPAVKDSPYLGKLTTRLILSQQSGFLNWRYLRQDKRLVFEFEPGTRFQYSGEGYEYLRKALENKFGKSLEQLASELLFKPFDMPDTHYVWTATTDESRYAVETDKDGHPIKYQKYTMVNAAANLLTTAKDYGKFPHVCRERSWLISGTL
jgi:CubicO group peptidase (beta-lactamase class C family)